MRFILFFLSLSIVIAPLCPAATLFTATYKGKYNGWNITLERSLNQIAPGQFSLVSKSNNFLGFLEEVSLFNLVDDQLIPQSYTYNRRVLGKTNSESIRFNWASREAIYTRVNKSQENRTLKLTPGLLDAALYQLQLQRDLAHQERDLSYSFVKRKDIKSYRFNLAGTDSFTLGGRQYKATIVERIESSAKKTRIWLLPELNWHIARIQHKEGSGDTYTIELARFTNDNTLMESIVRKRDINE